MKNRIITFLKEVGRLIIFSLPAVLIQVVSNDPALTGTYGLGVLLVLRAIDKAIHDDDTIASKGLLPF